MQVNRGLVFWGVALITAGAVALAIQSDLIDTETARQAWRLWPVVLIVIGLAVIAARSPLALAATLVAGIVAGGLAGTLVAGVPDGLELGCGGDLDERVTADGAFDGSAEVELDINCGDLTVQPASGATWAVDARFGGRAEPEIASDSDSLRVEADGGGGFLGFTDARQSWDVSLPTDVELELAVTANAAASRLDLAGMELSRLSIDTNAGDMSVDLAGASVGEMSMSANAASIELTVDGSTALDGAITLNAGSLDVCVAAGASVELTVNDDNITFSHDLDESGLDRSGDTWRSGDGPADVVLEIEGNAASLSYNPTGGCS